MPSDLPITSKEAAGGNVPQPAAGRAPLQRIFDEIPAYLSYIDNKLIYRSANQTYLKAFGRTAGEIVGRPVAEVLGASFSAVRGHLEAALRGEEQNFETRMGTLQEERILSVSHIPDRDESGEVCGVVVYGRDITERKRTEAALMQSEKLAAVGRLASSIAHEINNPLESVTNLLYLAQQETVSPEVRNYLSSADQELRRVSVIANQTLRFHKQSSNPQAVSAADLFATVLSIYEGRLRNLQIVVEVRHRTGEPIVCFEGDVRQVLNNLVGNALDAMSGSRGRLLIRSREGADYATGRRGQVFTIADTGLGMSREVSASIFEAFFTTKGIHGTGLGLWVSQGVVERHAGTLHVRSRPGAGTVFRLFLPHC